MRKALFVLAAVAVGGIAVAVLGRDRRARHYVPDYRSFGSPSGPAPVEEQEPATPAPLEEVVAEPVVEPTPVATAPVSIEPFVPAFTEAIEPVPVHAEAEADVVDSEWNELQPDPDEAASF